MNAYFKQALCHGTLATGTSTKQNKKTGIAERSATTDLMNQDDVQTHGFRNFQNFRFMNSMKSIVSLAGLLHEHNKNRIKSSKSDFSLCFENRVCLHLRPYNRESTASRLICEVNGTSSTELKKNLAPKK